jgi:uncharacterized lipoprotein YajG
MRMKNENRRQHCQVLPLLLVAILLIAGCACHTRIYSLFKYKILVDQALAAIELIGRSWRQKFF